MTSAFNGDRSRPEGMCRRGAGALGVMWRAARRFYAGVRRVVCEVGAVVLCRVGGGTPP